LPLPKPQYFHNRLIDDAISQNQGNDNSYHWLPLRAESRGYVLEKLFFERRILDQTTEILYGSSRAEKLPPGAERFFDVGVERLPLWSQS
jgi:hypothetical protein